ncbi:MAG: DNA/RNA non-specific endonuclease [Armatimonadota bacterium]|nr:DNA/RNA non-specific endonuclease [Armatimonadota bacterium]
MAKDKKRRKGETSSEQELEAKIDRINAYLRADGAAFLDDPNISSVGIGYRVKDKNNKEQTDELCVQFTVRKKSGESELESLGTTLIPKSLEIGELVVPTDVIQREHFPSYQLVEPEAKSVRKQRLDTLVPGISVSHPDGTAGTLGAIVYDRLSGETCMLSNWHVLCTPTGEPGDPVVQPGPYDDDRVTQNEVGRLSRSHLGVAGDCAIATIESRAANPEVLDLNVRPLRLARPNLRDLLVKSGRTTGVTHGQVRRIHVTAKINYGGDTGYQRVGGFEIGPAEGFPGADNEISKGGDSGSVWLVADEEGAATDIMVGLHFAGEGRDNPDEHALACYAHSVCEKLEIALEPPAELALTADLAGRRGYDPNFLGSEISVPELSPAVRAAAVSINGSHLIPYTHFSVCLNKDRRMAYFVAWNIDGAHFRRLSRSGLRFIYDPRIDRDCQTGEEVYSDNRLDRGHIARRADLCWGPQAEAMRSNKDSFYFTNIVPQHEAFNRSSLHGLWGSLENAIFEDVDVEDLRVSVMAGPIFRETDLAYRESRVPREFWKLIAYVDSADSQLKAKAYILTQDDLLHNIEALELDPFRLWQASIGELEHRANLTFGDLREIDAFVPEYVLEEMAEGERLPAVREIRSRGDLS